MDEQKLHHIDVGSKIGGARKDFGRRAMTIDDLAGMNGLEKGALVNKKNIWPPLDYEKMRDESVTAQVATALKYLRHKLNSGPDSVSESENYIAAITLIRDSVENVKTDDDFMAAMLKIHEVGGSPLSGWGRSLTALEKQWGYCARQIIDDGYRGVYSAKLYQEFAKILCSTSADPWGHMIKPKRIKSDADLETAKIKKENDRNLHCPHLEKVVREGTDWREGRNVNADDLIQTFGFRAIEFGNWLPQNERQQVLNMAYDSLRDLSCALDLPPQALSLGNSYALAFGSRGTGGTNAALAHHEPARRVINMTRMNGAGCLAHEWMHALDWHLGNLVDFGCAASELDAKEQSAPMERLLRSLKQRDSTPDEIRERAKKESESGCTSAISWLHERDPKARELLAQKLADLLKVEYAKLKDDCKVGSPSFNENGGVSTGVVSRSVVNVAKQFIGRDATVKTSIRQRITSNLRYVLHHLAIVATVDAVREIGNEFPASFLGCKNSVDSEFFKQAKELDKNTRSILYWATPKELFARAGAAHVSDQLESKGIRSDYLVYGSDNERHKNNPLGNPNPAEGERELFAQHFRALMMEYRMLCKDVDNSTECSLENNSQWQQAN